MNSIDTSLGHGLAKKRHRIATDTFFASPPLNACSKPSKAFNSYVKMMDSAHNGYILLGFVRFCAEMDKGLFNTLVDASSTAFELLTASGRLRIAQREAFPSGVTWIADSWSSTARQIAITKLRKDGRLVNPED